MIALESGMKKAVDWIAERLRENADASRLALIDEAGQRFGLSPLQTDFLYRQFLSPTPSPPQGGEEPDEERTG